MSENPPLEFLERNTAVNLSTYRYKCEFPPFKLCVYNALLQYIGNWRLCFAWSKFTSKLMC